MGFFDFIVSAGRHIGESASNATRNAWLEKIEKMKVLPVERLVDFYNQNNTEEGSHTSSRAAAILAMPVSVASQLLYDDEGVINFLMKIRRDISLDVNQQSDSLRRQIDELFGPMMSYKEDFSSIRCAA